MKKKKKLGRSRSGDLPYELGFASPSFDGGYKSRTPSLYEDGGGHLGFPRLAEERDDPPDDLLHLFPHGGARSVPSISCSDSENGKGISSNGRGGQARGDTTGDLRPEAFDNTMGEEDSQAANQHQDPPAISDRMPVAVQSSPSVNRLRPRAFIDKSMRKTPTLKSSLHRLSVREHDTHREEVDYLYNHQDKGTLSETDRKLVGSLMDEGLVVVELIGDERSEKEVGEEVSPKPLDIPSDLLINFNVKRHRCSTIPQQSGDLSSCDVSMLSPKQVIPFKAKVNIIYPYPREDSVQDESFARINLLPDELGGFDHNQEMDREEEEGAGNVLLPVDYQLEVVPSIVIDRDLNSQSCDGLDTSAGDKDIIPRGGCITVSMKSDGVGRRSWVEAAKGSSLPSEDTLECMEPGEADTAEEIIFAPEDVIEEVARWSNTIVIHVAGQRPYFPHFLAYLQRVWKVTCGFQLFSRDNGCFLVRFKKEDECKNILEKGPWLFDGRYLMMKLWKPNISLEKEILTRIPIWIRLPEFPLLLWSRSGLSKVSSKLGNPIRMDEPTTTRRRLSFARVLVEIDAKEELREDITLSIRGGGSYKQKIVYEWKPPRCSRCVCFGHSTENCPLKIRKEWVPTTTSEEGATEQVHHPNPIGHKRASPSTYKTSKPIDNQILASDEGVQTRGKIRDRTQGSTDLKLNQISSGKSMRSYLTNEDKAKTQGAANPKSNITGAGRRTEEIDGEDDAQICQSEHAGVGSACKERQTMENPEWNVEEGWTIKGGKSNIGKGKMKRGNPSPTSGILTRGFLNKKSYTGRPSGPGRPP